MKISWIGIYKRVSSIAPVAFTRWLGSVMIFAGEDKEPREKAGEWLLASFVLALPVLVYYIFIYHTVITEWTSEEIFLAAGLFALVFLVSCIMFYLSLYYKTRKRSIEMEKVLPDFLLLIVSNLRAGMTPWEAFIGASRPEFGALHWEIRRTSGTVSGEASLSDALEGLSGRFESKILERTVKLFGKGARAGGKIAKILLASSQEIRTIQDMRQELIITTRNYTIFLAFIVVFLMPFLLAVSTHFISTFAGIHAQTSASSHGFVTGGAVLMGGNVLITANEMALISIGTLVMTSLLIALLTGVIGSGRALDGARYFPLFAAASVIMYMLSRAMLANAMAQFG